MVSLFQIPSTLNSPVTQAVMFSNLCFYLKSLRPVHSKFPAEEIEVGTKEGAF
jgi:hypothetical protein